MTTRSLPELEHYIGARLARRALTGAAAAAAACREAWPQAVAGWLYGSMVALLLDDRAGALTLAEQGLRLDPTRLEALLQRAECLLALGRRADAAQAAEAAASSAGTDPAALGAVAEFWEHAGDYAAALVLYDRALEAAPADARALRMKRAVVHSVLGNFEAAAADYEAILAAEPLHAGALEGLIELATQSPENNRVSAATAALAAAAPGSPQAAALHFALGKAYEDLGRYAESWQHVAAANRLERARIRYDRQLDRSVIDALIAGFPESETGTGVGAGGSDAADPPPIFIVGLPRTGTTLVDRILGSHSEVHSAGELAALSEALAAAVERSRATPPRDWPEYAQALAALDGDLIAREYLDRARAHRGAKPRYTDKQPANFLYCGLIARAFPGARIVHLTRHPLATCHAIFKTRFRNAYPFAYDLTDLGEFYVDYRRLMDHWNRILPGRILNLAYEDVVRDQEAATRRLLGHVGLPFEAGCLAFEHNPLPVTTASAVQVRRPLYDTSLEQWRHFAPQLAPLAERLSAAGIAID